MKSGLRQVLSSLFVLAMVAYSISGCGGGSTTVAAPEGTGSSSVTQQLAPPVVKGSTQPNQQFIARAETICQSLNAEIAAVKAKSGSKQEVERVVPRHASAEHAAVAALSKLTPPVSLAPSWRVILGYRQTLAEELDRLVESAKHNDSKAIAKLTASKKRVHSRLHNAATKDGFKECASVGTEA